MDDRQLPQLTRRDNASVEKIAAPSFNYADLDAGTAQLARNTAQKLRNCQRQASSDIIVIGADLLEVKDALGHGGFTQWLRTEFPNDKRTAQRMMQVAARIPKDKSDTVSLLPPTLLYILTAKSMPQKVINEVIADLEGGASVEVVKAKIDSNRAGAIARHYMEGARSRRSQQLKLDARAAAQGLVEEFGLATVKCVLDAVADRQVASALRTIILKHGDNTAVSVEDAKAELAPLDGDLSIPSCLQRELPNPIN
jgi:hypothetical protein